MTCFPTDCEADVDSSIKRGKTSFAVPLSGGMRLQDRKLTNAVVELVPSASGEVSYQVDV